MPTQDLTDDQLKLEARLKELKNQIKEREARLLQNQLDFEVHKLQMKKQEDDLKQKESTLTELQTRLAELEKELETRESRVDENLFEQARQKSMWWLFKRYPVPTVLGGIVLVTLAVTLIAARSNHVAYLKKQERETVLKIVENNSFGEAKEKIAFLISGDILPHIEADIIDLLDTMVVHKNKASVPPKADAGFYYARAEKVLLQGKHSTATIESAVHDLNMAIYLSKNNTNNQQYYEALAKANLALKDYNGVLCATQAVLYNNPANGTFWYLQGQAQYNTASYKDALRSFNKAIKYSEDRADVYNWRGLTHEKLQMSESACNDFYLGRNMGSTEAQANYETYGCRKVTGRP